MTEVFLDDLPASFGSRSDKWTIAWLSAVGIMIVVISAVGWAAQRTPATPILEKEQPKEPAAPANSKPVETMWEQPVSPPPAIQPPADLPPLPRPRPAIRVPRDLLKK